VSAVYKFVELSTVTDEALEEVVNAQVALGWQLDVIHFAMREASRRPAMAFVQFVRDAGEGAGAGAGDAGSAARPPARP